MERADFVRRSGQRDVDLSERRRFFLRLKLSRARFDRRRNSGADFVEQLADDRLLLLRERFHLLAPRRNASSAPQIAHANVAEGFLVVRAAELTHSVLPQRSGW